MSVCSWLLVVYLTDIWCVPVAGDSEFTQTSLLSTLARA